MEIPRVGTGKSRMALDPELRNAVYERDAWRCRSCRSRNNLTPHHFVFKSQGGGDTMHNLVTLCMICHDAVHNGNLKLEFSSYIVDRVEFKFTRLNGWRPQ